MRAPYSGLFWEQDAAAERLHDSTTAIRVGWEGLERGIDRLKS
jgi:hypothetical protein